MAHLAQMTRDISSGYKIMYDVASNVKWIKQNVMYFITEDTYATQCYTHHLQYVNIGACINDNGSFGYTAYENRSNNNSILVWYMPQAVDINTI